MADDNVKVTRSRGKWGLDTFTAAPVPLPKPHAEFVRMRHPTTRGLYYCSIRGEWVQHGWTVWKKADWEAKFSGDTERHWEFFGYTIPLKVAE